MHIREKSMKVRTQMVEDGIRQQNELKSLTRDKTDAAL
jgi:hypothetical protein